jgi:PAS domain S-box-containing protein
VNQSSPLYPPRSDPRRFDERERLIAALKVSRAGTWRWDILADVVEWDDALCEMYGITRKEAPTCSQDFLTLVHPEDRASVVAAISASIKTGVEADFQFRAIVGDAIRWIYDRSDVIRGADGKSTHMLGACIDITERRRVEQERDALLEKQTILLQELVHRTKNHLSMVISMLRLKASRQTSPAARQDFEQAIERIHTIAFLHEHLYRKEVLDRIDIHSYLEDICANLELSLLTDSNVSLIRELQPAELHIDQAVPLGLIVNEVVTNAAKYAFQPGKPGTIVVRFRKREDRGIMTISDDGRGLVRNTKVQGIGTKLIRSLAGQIGARLRVGSRKGVTYSLTFRTME